MRRVGALLLVALFACSGPRVATPQVSASPVRGTYESLQVDGRPVVVFRPRVANVDTLPVVYYLHGLPGFAGDAFVVPGLPAIEESMLARGGRPYVIAAPSGTSAAFFDSEWADSADGRQRIETWLTTKVIDAVEGAHRRPKALRAITGYSMGGYGAVNIGLHHTDLFGQVVGFAGYYRLDDNSGVFGHDAAVRNRNQPDRNVAAGRRTRTLLLEGTKEGERLIRGEASRMGALLRAAGADVTVRILEGGHGPGTLGRGWPVIADFLTTGWHQTPS